MSDPASHVTPLAFERTVLKCPEAHTYGAVRTAGDAVFARLDDLIAASPLHARGIVTAEAIEKVVKAAFVNHRVAISKEIARLAVECYLDVYDARADGLAAAAAITPPNEIVAGERKWPRNPFKKDILKKQFAACVYCYFSRDKDFFRADGSRNMGNGVANQFWWGFDGVRKPEQWNAASKDTPAYASYRAGEMIATYEASLTLSLQASAATL
jgi:hypothetical protein|nr:hypothetical protein [Neorhizobium tomejilense]